MQSILQELSIFDREIFVSIIILFTTKIYIVENKINLFLYIRIVLKFFVLYFIIILNFIKIYNSCAIYRERQVEIILETIFSSRIFFSLSTNLSKNCLRLIAQQEKILYCKYCRFEIIKTVVNLTNNILLCLLFIIYNYKS